MKHLLIYVLVFGFPASPSSADVFSAMADMEALLSGENDVTGVIDEYIEKEMQRLEQLKLLSKEYSQRNKEAIAEGASFVSNPLNAYLLIRRLKNEWDAVQSLMRNNVADEFILNITSHRRMNEIKYPDQEDLAGAAVALVRLQTTYRLNTQDMAKGVIMGDSIGKELTALDCFEVGRAAYNAAEYFYSLSWMQETYDRSKKEQPPTANMTDVLKYLSFSLCHQGNVKHAFALTHHLARITNGNVTLHEEMLVKECNLRGGRNETSEDDTILLPIVNERKVDSESPSEVYQALCRGEVPVNETARSRLFCYYKRDQPYLLLAPIKTEIVHLHPLAVMFRDVVSDYEISVIKELAIPKLLRAMVRSHATGQTSGATYRISKSAFLTYYEDPVIAEISARVAMMTNLNQETYESLQIVNYGLGGHYAPHYDFTQKGHKSPFPESFGNRIATVLFYLSQPERGGATVFPLLKTGFFPSVNDALFWYNLQRDGDGDMRTFHAGCPVLTGSKWVANMWIHEREQEFLRPCALEQHINEMYVGDLGD